MSDTHHCPHQDVCSTTPPYFHAVAALSGLSSLRALVVNHRTVAAGVLRSLSLGVEQSVRLHDALSAAGVESFVLATCNRTEIYWRTRAPGDNEFVRRAFAQAIGAGDIEVREIASPLRGDAAAIHLFRVCSGLESLVLGEAEILGQVRTALDACGGAGTFLRGVVQAALRTGRSARAETLIGAGAQSVASAAVQALAAAIPLAASRVMVVGAGDTGLKAARHLRSLGAGSMVVANRTLARAQALAKSVAAEAIALEDLEGELIRADALVCAVASSSPVITNADLRRAVTLRSGRPLVIVDISMPPAVEAGEVDGVTRIDMITLERQVSLQRNQRQAEVPRVEGVIEREMGYLHAWARHEVLRPLVSDLRRKVESIRRAELARAEDEFKAQNGDLLDRFSRRLLDQLLALPLATLEAGDVPLDVAQIQYLRRLFALESGASKWL